jgi:hypothetical protein
MRTGPAGGIFFLVEEWAKVHEAEPQITSFSEYGLEKNRNQI